MADHVSFVPRLLQESQGSPCTVETRMRPTVMPQFQHYGFIQRRVVLTRSSVVIVLSRLCRAVSAQSDLEKFEIAGH
jgi:hypothetical protein